MAINQHASNLIDITAKAFNGDVISISPTDGLSLVDSWISFLKSDGQENNPITNRLTELRTELQESNLNGARIQDILNDLVGQTTQLADSAEADNKPRLTTLAEALQGFNEQLNLPTPMTNPDKQAPMTSTVGGESTTSGAGMSAVGTSDDDLSNRNGGTVSSGPTVEMEATPDNGRLAASGSSSNESRDASNSQTAGGDSYSSVSDVAEAGAGRVGGMGISGGDSDSDSIQSGGRSSL
ncbi:hypothetical protein [Spirosoma radiotolerans]|uniref:Uncharacterized protein n=1 Tax=Spirosoma radiotolerans TaxID=1379870 RepID=A0A0E3ZZG3_9BACT|nr:hypothetical protein [Spirosoma radiotolerans]AKD57650.1 hypothetical protein SD10_24910 [Spirosoma radiotolerans]